MPVFSILTPVFNEALFVKEMLDSVRFQDFQDWELIVVDDGSTDETASIVRDQSKLDARIKLIEPGCHIGKVQAINLAYSLSSGDIIFHLAGDDLMVDRGFDKRLECFRFSEDGLLLPGQSAFFKMQTFSEDLKFDNLLLPKGPHSSKTGSSPTFTRDVAERIFPVDTSLTSEDLWIGFLAQHLVSNPQHSRDAAWLYRIHADNSNPRHKSYSGMSMSMSRRMRVWGSLVESDRFKFSDDTVQLLMAKQEIEQLRRRGNIIGILFCSKLDLIDRMATASMASPLLFRIRMTFYRTLTGIRGA